jgi:SulP family sulfate permease
MAAALAVVVGLLCLAGRVLRLGALADLLSRRVLVGYMAGVAVLMVVSQLTHLTGVPTSGTRSGPRWLCSSRIDPTCSPRPWRWCRRAGVPAAGGVVIPTVPGVVVGHAAGRRRGRGLGLQARGIDLIEDIPAGLPVPVVSRIDLHDLATLLLPAVGVAVVAYSDNVLTARVFATRNRCEVDADQELLALGAANVAGGLVQGFPVSSMGSSTGWARTGCS